MEGNHNHLPWFHRGFPNKLLHCIHHPVAVVLHFNEESLAWAENRQCLSQSRYTLIGKYIRMRNRSKSLEFGIIMLLYAQIPAIYTLCAAVVIADDNTVRRKMYIRLKAIGVMFHGIAEGRGGILRRHGGLPFMGNEKRMRPGTLANSRKTGRVKRVFHMLLISSLGVQFPEIDFGENQLRIRIFVPAQTPEAESSGLGI